MKKILKMLLLSVCICWMTQASVLAESVMTESIGDASVVSGALASVDAIGQNDRVVLLTTKTNYEFSKQVLDLVNQERATEGIDPLVMDQTLLEIAMQRAAEGMVHFDHTRPNGLPWHTMHSKLNGENIALGQRTPEQVVNSWMNSSGHRENIMDPKFKSIGIGCVGNAGYGRINYCWTQVFSQSSGRPAVDQSSGLKTFTIEVNPTMILDTTLYLSNRPDQFIGDSIITMNQGESTQLYPFIRENPVTAESVDWHSDHPEIVKVENGKITALAPGEANITISIAGGLLDQSTIPSEYYTKTVTVQPPYALGDVDADRWIAAGDALLVLRHSVCEITLQNDQFIRADVTFDQQVNSSDALKILRYSVGEITTF